MEGEYVKAALSLLKKAGCMDLVRQEALPALRPARKAVQGVAAAVMACSPPRAGARPGRASRAGRARRARGGSTTLARRAGGATGGWPKLITRVDGAEAFGGGRSRGTVWRQGFAPASAASSWEQCPGTSGVQPVVNMRRTVRTTAGELPRRAQEVLGYGNELWREDDCILDYDETSLEEGELVDDGEEEI
ncbi:hypothetical protein NDU88_002252 [Pleurodeles waltl]|uniref:Uncharacterized protein n=1 Tax=Pleurodeles waltl TaxID=8319 RepID=A0AAV7MMM3_PLEWA|nr:hypothetical protein NDU88_002252 [Pleurodeles waltl]